MIPFTLGLYEKALPPEMDWKQKLEFAKTAGFDFMEISIDETEEKLARLDMSPAERMALVNTAQVVGLPIRTMCLSCHRKYPLGSMEDKTVKKSLEIMEKAIQLADDLGIRIIQLAGYDVYYEESSEKTRQRFMLNLVKAVEMASAKSIILGFETMETAFLDTVGKALNYVNSISSAYLNIYPDIGNLTNAAVLYGQDVLEDIFKGRGKIVAVHLKETKPGVYREVPFGTGHVDFSSSIEAAWAIGIRKFVIEMWYTGNKGWEEDISAAQKLMQESLLKVICNQDKITT